MLRRRDHSEARSTTVGRVRSERRRAEVWRFVCVRSGGGAGRTRTSCGWCAVRSTASHREPGAVVQVVADRNGVSTGQLYTWRKEMLAAAVSGFVPVAVTPEAPRIEGPAPRQEASTEPGVIEVVLASGVVVRTSGRVDMGLLCGVLAELGGR